ncbi:unnamed protein product [Spodoptera exigua]|nr:unnamed protein product [Spodoptera exigua]
MSLEEVQDSKKALIYLPYSEYCTDHQGLFLHEDEKLVKPGDKFKSHDDFVQYLNENAKRWCFYYSCSDSRNPNTGYETYTYNCVYLRTKEKYKKKGLRKRSNNMKTDCPCKIKLRHLPNEKELTVVYVCNHHDHELSLQEFYKLQHGRRLPPYVKEEIKDFLQLKVDLMKIKAYVEMETGFNMSRPFFYTLEKNMKRRDGERHISEQRLKLLQQKIAAVDEMFGDNEDESTDARAQHDNADDEVIRTKKIINRSALKNITKTLQPSSTKRRKLGSIIYEEDISDTPKRMKINTNQVNSENETLQSVKNLQESANVKCEIEPNPWIADQCAPVLVNSYTLKQEATKQTEGEESVHIQTVEHLDEDLHILVQNGIENLGYTIQYCDDSTQEIISNEYVSEEQVNHVEENQIDNIAYETVVTDGNETQEVVEEYIAIGESIEGNMHEQQEGEIEQSEIVEQDYDNTQDVVEEDSQVQYITEDGEVTDSIVQYVGEVTDESYAQDVAVQTADKSGNAQTLLPVFDVYMKDGNVTGFVVNDNLITGLKDGVDKEIQTNDELLNSNSVREVKTDDYNVEIIQELTKSKHGDTYTKHEYVHRYNIDKYMIQPHFPKYVDTLAKETGLDVLHMFTNIYKEKAMFKITTTQRGKEGDTRIWYVKNGVRAKKNSLEESNREKLGRNLQSIFILKEKLRYMKQKNSELIIKNKQLEEVALKLVEMTS